MTPTLLAAEAGHSATAGRLLEAVALIVVVAAATAAARRLPIVSPILLVLVGFALSYLPGIPAYALDPELVLLLILPPLLYAAAWRTSLPSFRANLRPIALLSVGLVLFTALVVGVVAVAVVPGLPFAAAVALGAIVAPPDAVAATAVASRAGLPRRVVAILEGESLLNDATALTTYRLAVAAVASGFSMLEFGYRFVLAAIGGAAVGLALALTLAWVRRRLPEPVLDTTLTLVAPFLAYVAAEEIEASGVIAVVVAGLYLGHRAPTETLAATRLQAAGLWETLEFLLQGIVFALIGLQLRSILEALTRYDAGTVALASLAVVVAVIASRFVWMFPATYLTRLVPRVRERDPAPPWQYPTVIAWAGMRGVVSLAAAAALPATFPMRDLLIFLTFVVIVVTLVVQGLSLPWLIRHLGIPGPSRVEEALQEASVQQQAATAAQRRLDELLQGEDGLPDGVAERLRDQAELRALFAWERLGSRDREPPSSAFRRLRREMVEAERAVFVQARDEGRLDQETFLQVLRELDTEEVLLARE